MSANPQVAAALAADLAQHPELEARDLICLGVLKLTCNPKWEPLFWGRRWIRWRTDRALEAALDAIPRETERAGFGRAERDPERARAVYERLAPGSLMPFEEFEAKHRFIDRARDTYYDWLKTVGRPAILREAWSPKAETIRAHWEEFDSAQQAALKAEDREIEQIHVAFGEAGRLAEDPRAKWTREEKVREGGGAFFLAVNEKLWPIRKMDGRTKIVDGKYSTYPRGIRDALLGGSAARKAKAQREKRTLPLREDLIASPTERLSPIVLAPLDDRLRACVRARGSLPTRSKAIRAARRHLEALLLGAQTLASVARAERIDPENLRKAFNAEKDALRGELAPFWDFFQIG